MFRDRDLNAGACPEQKRGTRGGAQPEGARRRDERRGLISPPPHKTKNTEGCFLFYISFPRIIDLLHIFRKPHIAGAIAASGNELSELITDLADLHNAHTVVEFGPGTGVFTRVALRKLPSDVRYIAIERDPDFLQKLRAEFKNVRLYEDSASSIENHLAENGKKCCDRIISGLPWTIFNEQVQTETLGAAHRSLCDGGIFITFAYVHSQFMPGGVRFKKLLKQTFSAVTTSRIAWRNLPPAFVYICKK